MAAVGGLVWVLGDGLRRRHKPSRRVSPQDGWAGEAHANRELMHACGTSGPCKHQGSRCRKAMGRERRAAEVRTGGVKRWN